MKKLLAIITCSLLLVCTVLPFGSSAAGMILWQEDFSAVVEDNWIWEGTKFEIIDGKLDGWNEAVVQQSYYREEDNGNKKFGDCTIKITAHGVEDGGTNSDSHSIGLWFADYISEDGSEDMTTGQIVYKWMYNYEKAQMELYIELANDGEAFAPADWVSSGEIYRSYALSDFGVTAPQLDSDESEAFTIGIRVNGAVLQGYLNDKKIMEFNTIRGAQSFQSRKSPVILLNGHCHVQFDDLIVATVDYDLFNDGFVLGGGNDTTNGGGNDTTNGGGGGNIGGGGAGNLGGGGNGGGGNAVDSHVVTKAEEVTNDKGEVMTDDKGNAITQIVSEIVTVPAADTNNGALGNGGAQTGDMAVVVVAVMVIALGSALAVKKISIK